MPTKDQMLIARRQLDPNKPPITPPPPPDPDATPTPPPDATPTHPPMHSVAFGGTDEPFDPDNLLGLTDMQYRAIQLTVLGNSDVKIAEMLGVNRCTLWRWKTLDDRYRKALDEARRQAHAIAADRVQVLLLKAVAVLDQHLDDPRMENQFRAAHVLLTMAGAFKPLPPPPNARHCEDDDQPLFPPEPKPTPKAK
jgi:hypothetical protein